MLKYRSRLILSYAFRSHHIIRESDSMKKTGITVTEAARNFADCVKSSSRQMAIILDGNVRPQEMGGVPSQRAIRDRQALASLSGRSTWLCQANLPRQPN